MTVRIQSCRFFFFFHVCISSLHYFQVIFITTASSHQNNYLTQKAVYITKIITFTNTFSLQLLTMLTNNEQRYTVLWQKT